MTTWSRIIALPPLLCCLCGGALGQSVDPSRYTARDSTWNMEEVVISAAVSGFVPSISIVLDSERIRDDGAWTIGELLRGESGLQLTTGAKSETEFRIRGFPANATVVLLDGHPLNSGYYGKVDLSTIALESIASITILKGPSSVAYGSEAMGGVVNIETRQPSESAHTSIDAEVGDLGHRSLGVHHSQRIDRWSYAVSLYEQAREAFPLASDFEPRSLEDGGMRDNSAQQLYGGRIRLGCDLSETERFALHLGGQHAARDVPTTIYSWDSPTWHRFPDMYRYNASLSGSARISPSIQLATLLFYDASGDNLIEYRNASFSPEDIVFDSFMDNQSLGGSMSLRSSALRTHSIGAGVRYRYDLVHRQPHTDRDRVAHRFESANLFVEDIVRPWSRCVLTFGLSQTYFTNPTSSAPAWKLCPMIGVTHNLVSDLQINAGVSRTVRYPSAQQLFSEATGNPELQPEDSWKTEAGFATSLPSMMTDLTMDAELAAHWSELHNLIYRVSSAHMYTNISSARLYGMELRGRARIGDWLEIDASFDHLVRDARSEEALRNLPSNALRFAWQIRTQSLTFRHEFGSVGTRPTLRTDDPILPAYSMHTATASARLPGDITLRIRVLNIFDIDYQEEIGYPASGRMIFIGATWVK